MTQALCLKCGEIKHGAFCRCYHCGGRADPDKSLAIALSDHHLSRAVLERLGELVGDIAMLTPDGDVRRAALLLFFNDAMPTRYHRGVDASVAQRARDVLDKVALPTIRIVSGAGVSRNVARPAAAPRTAAANARRASAVPASSFDVSP